MDTTTASSPEGLTPAQLRAWRSFLEAHAAVVDVLERELRAEEDLPLSWYDVLVQLSEAASRSLRMQELAERVLLSKSGLTRLVDRMEHAGLVERAACEQDRRGTYARLTDAGLQRLQATTPTHVRGVREHFAQHLEDHEADLLANALGRVAGAQAAAVTA
jgi:DNA-binding MarR family transcriptional regulator